MSAEGEPLDLEALIALPWSRQLVADADGRLVASVPELEGCFADGDTPAEALASLDVVLRDWLEIALEERRAIPEPRRQDQSEPSGRFSVRVPRSLHRRLAEAAEREGSSLNQFVNVILARAVERPIPVSGTQEPPAEDAHENLTALAVRSGPQSIGPLKGIARFVRDRGDVHLSCLIYALAATRIEVAEGTHAASREFGMASALARRHGSHQLAEALLRESLQHDPTNLRSFSALGQLLHHQGRYEEAADCLERAAGVDNHARLFLGWSRLLAGLDARDDEAVAEGAAQLGEALREWAYGNHSPTERTSWIRQLRRLRALGTRFADGTRQLIEFANAHASWGEIEMSVADEPWSAGDDPELLASEQSATYDDADAQKTRRAQGGRFPS